MEYLYSLTILVNWLACPVFQGGLLAGVVLLTRPMALSQEGEAGPVESTSWSRPPPLSWPLPHFSTSVTGREIWRTVVYMHVNVVKCEGGSKSTAELFWDVQSTH